jgi:hypothetical protein
MLYGPELEGSEPQLSEFFFNGPLSFLRGADSTSCIGGWAETRLSLRRIGLEKSRVVVVIFYSKCHEPKLETN